MVVLLCSILFLKLTHLTSMLDIFIENTKLITFKNFALISFTYTMVSVKHIYNHHLKYSYKNNVTQICLAV